MSNKSSLLSIRDRLYTLSYLTESEAEDVDWETERIRFESYGDTINRALRYLDTLTGSLDLMTSIVEARVPNRTNPEEIAFQVAKQLLEAP